MNETLFELIRLQGVKKTIEQIIVFSENQIKLHEMMNNLEQFNFWLNVWMILKRSQNEISLGINHQDALSEWKNKDK